MRRNSAIYFYLAENFYRPRATVFLFRLNFTENKNLRDGENCRTFFRKLLPYTAEKLKFTRKTLAEKIKRLYFIYTVVNRKRNEKRRKLL